ncbi:MAG: hypothetical protein CVU38_17410 [Chloroflexi bacterium HGW-Chloroflexi-1]|nr:MAG: hypothetical protein CVU38_17410 [Chloroflexi bacterium HGW-Chloroflexi-1]
MSTPTVGTPVSISLPDLEDLMRRVVREVVREELFRSPRPPTRSITPSILADWSQEGPDDPAGDNELLAEAMVVLDEYGDKPESWMTWADFEAKLDRAEARGELPG